jgi:hypothetical protein
MKMDLGVGCVGVDLIRVAQVSFLAGVLCTGNSYIERTRQQQIQMILKRNLLEYYHFDNLN